MARYQSPLSKPMDAPTPASHYAVGDRIKHATFGPGAVTRADGTKLTVAFDKGGEKKVIESFVERA